MTLDNLNCRSTALRYHFRRRLECRDGPVRRLIGPCASANIQDRFGRSQSRSDQRLDPGVWFPQIRIVDTDRIAGSAHDAV